MSNVTHYLEEIDGIGGYVVVCEDEREVPAFVKATTDEARVTCRRCRRIAGLGPREAGRD